MVDILTPEQRSKCMASIRGRNTQPELIVRKLVHAMGFRYRLHKKGLPGKPDIVFSRLGKIIFVHGCFWHIHRCKFGRVKPKTNPRFWLAKRESNRKRDQKNRKDLRRMAWDVLVVWECWIRDPVELENRIWSFLD